MPLRDHFHAPVKNTHSWDELHGGWPMEMVRSLADFLPKGYRAGPNVHLGSTFEVDIGTYEQDGGSSARRATPGGGGVATVAAAAWSPTLTVDADLLEFDEYEVNIYDAEHGRRLVAAIELVSPANKDRPKARQHFVGKVAALLAREVCVTIVDVVSVRLPNLYAELLASLDRADPNLGAPPPAMYAVTLRSRPQKRGLPLLDAWHYAMPLGEPLPTLPIWLEEDLRILFPLEPSYEETCRVLGIA